MGSLLVQGAEEEVADDQNSDLIKEADEICKAMSEAITRHPISPDFFNGQELWTWFAKTPCDSHFLRCVRDLASCHGALQSDTKPAHLPIDT